MRKTWCITEKVYTSDVLGNARYTTAKNGRTFLKSTCASCGITKTKFVKMG